MSEEIEGRIAAILGHSKVVLNKGSRDGVKEDDEFIIYSQLGPFFDPETKESLGVTNEVWGTVSVTILEERFCVAETSYEWRQGALASLMNSGALFAGERVQIKLPVREDQIQSGFSRIQVGYHVRRLARSAKELPKELKPVEGVEAEE